jgi:tape measure domain-containing protein
VSFNAAELVATIRLDGLEKVGRDLDTVRGNLERTDTAAAKVGRAAKAAFTGASAAIGVTSVAAGVLLAKLLSTGVAYNTLQQTSRAALATLLGGAQQANAQMDRLDAFARTSPFSKSVFITAQQQLIGFGLEAQKVIPTLNAVQNAVAATGGSSQELGDIVFILAQIQAAGKITGQDLLQLGQRGLDAASMIGAGMGKTADEIREEITGGTLDARAALDALVVGMEQRYAGAASNVKNTFTGTVDRIRAASRDIGAALAEPFVSKNGGGLAVTWGNQVADVLRAVEKQVTPVVTILTTRANPAFADMTAILDRARVTVNSWNPSRLEGFLEDVAANGPAIAATAGAVIGLNSALLRQLPIVGMLIPAISPLGGILGGVALASPEVRKELAGLFDEMKPLIPVAGDLAEVVSGALNAALPVVASGIRLVTAVAGPLVDVIDAIPAPMLATVVAALAVNSALRAGAPAIQSWLDGWRRLAEQAAVQAALAGMEGNTSRLAGAFGVAGRAATGFGNSLKAAFVSNPVGLIILGVSTAAAVLTAALSAQGQEATETRERIDGYRETLDETTASTLRATTALARKRLEEEKGLEIVQKLGVSTVDLAAAVSQGGDSYERLIERLRELEDAEKQGSRTGQAVATLRSDAIKNLRERFEEERAAVLAAQEAQRLYNEEQRAAAAAMTETERSNTRMNEALAIARDVSNDATERLKALKQALDELNGPTKSQAEQTRDLNEQADRLREVFSQTDEAGNKLAASLVSASGEIDTTTAAGRSLYDEVDRLNDQMLDAIILADESAKADGRKGASMQEAADAAQPYIDKLWQIGHDSGLSDEQVQGLIDTMLATPSVVAFALTDDGTIDANRLRLVDLAQQIIDTPDKEFEVSSDDFPFLKEALAALGVDITSLPAGTVKVAKDDGSFRSVEEELTRLARSRTVFISTTGIPTSTVGRTGFAGGGPIMGPGTGTSDSVPILASNGEHMIPTNEVNAAGGHAGIYRLRRAILDGALRYANGGEITPIGPRSPHLVSAAAATLAPRGGDVHLHASLTPRPGESIASQLKRGVKELEIRLQTGTGVAGG